MIRRPMTFALVPLALSAQLGTAHAQTPRPATTRRRLLRAAAQAPAVVLPDNPVEARETRDQLMEVLRQYPPSLAEVLRLDPSLLTSEQYIATYPGLAAFVARHPEVARNPGYFFGTEHVRSWEDYGPRAEAIQVWRNVIDGVQIFSVFACRSPARIIWLVKMLVDHRRWLRQSKVQTEVHTKLMDRFTSNDDLLAYIQSPAGKRFLESAPISLDAEAPPRNIGAPFGRIFWSVQAGAVLLLTGFGLQFVGQRQQWEEIGQPLSSMGILVVAIGLGFLISAAASYFLSRRLGLLPDYNAKRDVPAPHDSL